MDMDSDTLTILLRDEFEETIEEREKRLKAQQREDLEYRRNQESEHSTKRKRLQKELDKMELDAKIDAAKQAVEVELDGQKRRAAQDELDALEREKKLEEGRKQAADYIKGEAFSTMKSVVNAITSSAQTYSGYVDRIQTRLLGANETVGTISSKLSQAFGASPIFQMKSVMEKVSQAVEKGINFNVESRAAMEVLKDKVAATFDAFDSSLLRLVRIQQADSTQARLGMEAMLTEFLNREFQDSSYLANNINSQVTNALVEAESRLSRESATQFEYAIQKWLGSMSSVGVSDSLVQKLAQGLGYLASGDVTSLSGQSDLESLLVASANRGGANYGSMLTNGVTVNDINAIFTGLRSLVEEIGKNGNNVVALNQYAKTFGMTVSDMQAMLNLGSDAITEISSDMKTMSELQQKVQDETTLLKLMNRTGGASIGQNIYENFLWGSGEFYGSNVASYMGWQMGGLVTDLLKGIESGIDVQPFGVGTHLNMSIGDLASIAQFTAGVLPGVVSMISSLGSIGGVNWGVLGDDQEEARGIVQKGNLMSFAETGKRQTSSAYVGDYSDSALAKTSNITEQKAVAEHTDDSFDEEKKKTEAMVDSMKEIRDDVRFITQLLNESGIVIRGRFGTTEPASFQESILEEDTAGHNIIGVVPV